MVSSSIIEQYEILKHNAKLGHTKKQIYSKPKDRTCGEIVSRISKRLINIQPDFQRNFVWDLEKQQRLIETLIISDGCLNPIYSIVEYSSGKAIEEVIDGQQRLTTIHNYMNNKFTLKKFYFRQVDVAKAEMYEKEFSGKYFKDLTEIGKNIIREATFPFITVTSDCDHNVKYYLFSQLNQGSVNLRPQEIRNCIYRGSFNDGLHLLANHPVIHRIFTNARGNKPNRMESEEFLLTLCYLLEDRDGFNSGSFKLNKFMHQFKNAEISKIKEWNQRIIQIFELIDKTLHADYPFRKSIVIDGKGSSQRIMKGVFLTLFDLFDRCIQNGIDVQILENMLYEELYYAYYLNERFASILRGGSTNIDNITKRSQILYDTLIQFIDKRPEGYTYEFQDKYQYGDPESKCPICGKPLGHLRWTTFYSDIYMPSDVKFWQCYPTDEFTLPKGKFTLIHKNCHPEMIK